MDNGTRIGQYEIIAKLGAGGMGEVYRARDATLKRDVAIKVLPAELAHDSDRLARLEREAQLLAALEHPNVATIYGLEESGDHRFLVMQLVTGDTLADRLLAGPLPLDEAVEIAGQIAAGLEAAHERGIVHRDLKPANLMVAPEGDVKILDFGLAKALGVEGGSDSGTRDLTQSPTIMGATAAGVILGTAAYMSPEQARGKPLDRRTDIWSFGCVVFEMLTGNKTFDGETVTDVIAAIVTSEPDWDRLPEETPDWLGNLLRRCLDKNPRQRLRDAGEARIALAAAGDGWGSESTGTSQAPHFAEPAVDRRGWLAAALVVVVAAVAVWVAWGESESTTPPAYVSFSQPGLRVAGSGNEGFVAVSRDGRSVAFATNDETGLRLWVRRLDEPAATPLPNDQSGSNIAWSVDGQQLSFDEEGELRVFDFRTGAASIRYRSDGQLTAATWTEDGRLVVGESRGNERRVLEVPGSGEAVTLATFSSQGGALQTAYPLPDDRLLVSYWTQAHGHVDTVILDAAGELEGPLLHLDAASILAPPDILLFAREGTLWAQRLDIERGQLSGEPVALVVEIDTAPNLTPWLSVGGNTLSYRTGVGNEAPTALEWLDREGRLIERIGEPENYFDPRISPDGEQFVFDRSNAADAGDIWVARRPGLPSRLTSAAADETRPVWAPDGAHVVIETSIADQSGHLYLKPAADPSADLVNLGADPVVRQATDWAGDTIVGNDASGSTIWIVDATDGNSRPFRETNFAERGGALSPDGAHIAYVSNETGTNEIWVESFPEPGNRRRISVAGGDHPVWRRDGRELLYVDPEGFVTAVAVLATTPLELGAPERLFQVALRQHTIRQFDVSPDGQRFLVVRAIEVPNQPIRLLLGWQQELARRAGPGW